MRLKIKSIILSFILFTTFSHVAMGNDLEIISSKDYLIKTTIKPAKSENLSNYEINNQELIILNQINIKK